MSSLSRSGPTDVSGAQDQASPSGRFSPMRSDPGSAVRTVVVREILDEAVAATAGGRRLDVVDLGGGTGGFAVPLAQAGHQVTVIDPSPDALAALQRRAAESGVAERVRALQGDAGSLAGLLGAESADVVLCHGVLEYADDPAAGIADAVAVLRSGGLLSLLVQQRLGAVLARAMAGRFVEAQRVLADPAGRSGDHDLRRFDRAQVLDMLQAAGVSAPGVLAVHGVRTFADLLSGSAMDADSGAAGALLDLERAAGTHPTLIDMAAQLHVLARV